MSYVARSLSILAPKSAGKRIAGLVMGALALVVAGLVWIPWRQTIVAAGEVIVFDAMSRPQRVAAPIPGRLVRWLVQEGQDVVAGQVIAELEDIDSKFLDPEQPARIDEQIGQLEASRTAAQGRLLELEAQKGQVETSRRNAIATARQRVEQARTRLRQAKEARTAAQKSLAIAQDVAARAASERLDQSQDRIEQAAQAVQFAENNLRTAELQRRRIAELFTEGLRSRRDDEVAENDLVKAKTELERAKSALEVARKDRNLGSLDRTRVDLEIDRVRTEVERANAAVDLAERDLINAEFDASKIAADTAASLNSVAATAMSARETIAKSSSDIVKADVDRRLLRRRVRQTQVVAPATGRVVRLMKVGAGEMVKVGDEMATVVPATADRHVELYVADNDVSLVSVGDLVRLQFAGYPAVQFAGAPTASLGTYGGRITLIDPVDDGSKKFRIVVEPHRSTLASGRADEPWPAPDRLRPGAEAVGWIMLKQVPLGYELWRQLNAFPPSPARNEGVKNQGAKGADKKSSADGTKVKFGK